jgi:tRNA(adenine34) deaminase
MNRILRKAKESGSVRDHASSARSDRLFHAPPGLALPAFTHQEEQRIARQVEQLRACAGDYRQFSEERVQRWLAWWEANHQGLALGGPLPRQAHTLALLVYMGLDPRQVPMVYEDDRTIIWRSTNFCPTLEACRRLDLDTRVVGDAVTEGSVQALIARLVPRLRFSRNYAAGIRPYADYCEETIELLD